MPGPFCDSEVGPVRGTRLLSVKLSDVIEIVGTSLLRFRLRKLSAGSRSRGRRSLSGCRGWRCGRNRSRLPRSWVSPLVIRLFPLLLSPVVVVAVPVAVERVQGLIVGRWNAGTSGVIWKEKHFLVFFMFLLFLDVQGQTATVYFEWQDGYNIIWSGFELTTFCTKLLIIKGEEPWYSC